MKDKFNFIVTEALILILATIHDLFIRRSMIKDIDKDQIKLPPTLMYSS